MKEIEKYISSLVESQFPSFYREDGSTFTLFIKAYYEWMEQENGIASEARSLLTYRDIDTTLDKFVENFQQKYMQGVPKEYDGDRRLLQKHIKEIYASKGSPRGLELLFKLLYNESIEVYIPSEDIMRASNSDYVVPRYLEMEFNTTLPDFTGKVITGRISGARAFVQEYKTFKREDNRFDILYISDIKGRFSAGEEISYEGITTPVNLQPKVRGSLSGINIIDGGIGFKIGDTFSIDAQGDGAEGKAVVTDVVQRAGFVSFDVRNGARGFSNTYNTESAGFSKILFPQYHTQINIERVLVLLNPLVAAGFTLNETITGLTSGATGKLVAVDGDRLSLNNVRGNFVQNETLRGLTSLNTTLLESEDLVSQASFEIGQLIDTTSEILSGVYISEIVNVPATWTRSGTTAYVKHKNHALRTGDSVALSNSSSVAAITNANKTVLNLDTAFSANTTAITVTANTHNYLTGAKVTIRSCSNTTLIPTQTSPTITVINSNTFSFPVSTSISTSSGTLVLNDFYNITCLNAGATSGTATVNTLINSTNYGGWCDRAITNSGTIDASLTADAPELLDPIDECIKFGTIVYGTIQDEKSKPSGLFNVFGGEGYETNVLVEIVEPIIYGLGRLRAPTPMAGTISISGDVNVTGVGTQFTQHFRVGSEIHVDELGQMKAKIASIASDTSMVLQSGFQLGFNPSPVYFNKNNVTFSKVNYLGKIEITPSNTLENSDVFGIAGYGKGSVAAVAIVDSGVAYQTGERLTLFNTNNPERTITGIAIAETDGKNEGRFKTSKGFLNSNKYIHDNNYYQEFSYEVRSSIPFEKYDGILKEVWHPAGVSKFGRVLIKDILPESGSHLTVIDINVPGSGFASQLSFASSDPNDWEQMPSVISVTPDLYFIASGGQATSSHAESPGVLDVVMSASLNPLSQKLFVEIEFEATSAYPEQTTFFELGNTMKIKIDYNVADEARIFVGNDDSGFVQIYDNVPWALDIAKTIRVNLDTTTGDFKVYVDALEYPSDGVLTMPVTQDTSSYTITIQPNMFIGDVTVGAHTGTI